MGLIRLRDWEERLAAYFAGTATTPFIWGRNDCALWSCNGIFAETGIDPSAPFKTEKRYRYKTARGAAGAMRRFAGGGLLEVAEKIAAEFAAPACPGLFYAQRGDLVLFDGAVGPTLGLVALDGLQVYSAGPEGRFSQRLRDLAKAPDVRAWRI